MATLVFSVLGASLGGSMLGGVFGAGFGTMLGRGLGAMFGRHLDQKLFGSSSQTAYGSPAERLRITNTHQGAAIPEFYGRNRVAGQIIWAHDFDARKDGKGNYEYSASFALALCEGVVHQIGRVWADGKAYELSPNQYRFYKGDEKQEQDPYIAAIEGKENTPRYAGIAYLVFEELKLKDFGNRIPNFEFEVFRHPNEKTAPDTRDYLRAVSLIPGSGEYVLSTSATSIDRGQGIGNVINVNRKGKNTDFQNSLAQLNREAPNLKSISLIVSWFGDDLRCDHCKIEPCIEQNEADGSIPWSVGDIKRGDARLVSLEKGKPVYGGTPSDQSVVEAIKALKKAKKEVMFYPFILMDVPGDNDKANPYGDGHQPKHPWRGRITLPIAAGLPGSLDQSSSAREAVDQFLGAASRDDFSITDGMISYSGEEAHSYRRFILHYAYLCKLAGGVDQFLIGSELRGLTRIRDDAQKFPFVDGLVALAEDVKAILGDKTQVSYAADWSEYFGYHPQHEAGSAYFNLDPLWASNAIDFIGIDNYMPLSDWRHSGTHEDDQYGAIYNLDYLKSNVAGGEGYDWYYADEEARQNQDRSAIQDGQGEDWIWRYKDLEAWWKNAHYDRVNGVRSTSPTPWQPQSKPFIFCEYGAAAIDLATNQPNKFIDPKSSESSMPHFSNGASDSFIQAQYIRAINEYWDDHRNNPLSEIYHAPMVDIGRAYYWCWDARPWPEFPGRGDVWADCENYKFGHWISGRINEPLLANVVAEICAPLGIGNLDTSKLYGLVTGIAFQGNESLREKLEVLMRCYHFRMFFKDGKIHFVSSGYTAAAPIDENFLIANDKGERIKISLGLKAKQEAAVEVHFFNADDDYQRASQVSSLPFREFEDRSILELPAVMSPDHAAILAEFMLEQGLRGIERVSFQLPPSQNRYHVGDVVEFPLSHPGKLFLIDRVEKGLSQQYEGFHILSRPLGFEAGSVSINQYGTVKKEPWALFFDCPIGNQDRIYAAISSRPWCGDVELGVSHSGGQVQKQLGVIKAPSTMGKLVSNLPKAAANLKQNTSLEVYLTSGVLGLDHGADFKMSFAALGMDRSDDWEILGFEHAELIGHWHYRLKGVHRGCFGTEVSISNWEKGANFVLIEEGALLLERAALGDQDIHHLYYGPVDELNAFQRSIKIKDPIRGSMPLAPSHLKLEGNLLSFIPRAKNDYDRWRDLERDFYLPHEHHILAYQNDQLTHDLVVREDHVELADLVSGPLQIEIAAISDGGLKSDYVKEQFNA